MTWACAWFTDPAVLVETMIETAAVAGGGGTQTVAVVDEIDAFTEQKCPNDWCNIPGLPRTQWADHGSTVAVRTAA